MFLNQLILSLHQLLGVFSQSRNNFFHHVNCTHRFCDAKLNEFTHCKIHSLRCVITSVAANLKSKYKPASGSPKKLQSLRHQDTSQDSFRINNRLRKHVNITRVRNLALQQKLSSIYFQLEDQSLKAGRNIFFCKTNWPLKKLH